MFLLLLVLPGSFLTLAMTGCGGEATVSSSGETTTAAPREARMIFHSSQSDVSISAEVASTPEQRAKGLMERTSMAADAGMVFVWDQDIRESFWMKNTLIPLSVAFIQANGSIIDIQDMEPQTLTQHIPPGPYRYAVEVNKGFFPAHGIKVGDRGDVLP